MRRLVGLLAFATGCDALFNLDPINAPPVDSALTDSDAETVQMDAPGCLGRYGAGNAGLAQVCLDQLVDDTWTPNGALYTGMFQDLGDCQDKISQNGTNTDLCLIAARNITIGGYLPTSGNRPIVFVATETFTLLEGATIGVDTRRGSTRRGAGSNENSCPEAADGTVSTAGSSGAAGGSFGTKGGNSGKGNGTASGTAAHPALMDVAVVRGGCPGGTGGGGSGTSGLAGSSGGAVYIIAGKSIEIRGTIDASGEAGSGGEAAFSNLLGGDGGGGGGSGGLIGLDSPSITITSTAILVANGGGGGGGGANETNGTNGTAGKEAQLTSPPNFPASGGPGGGAGGDGGKGASGSSLPDPGQPAGTSSTGNGGGSGGGGAGIIKFFSSGPPAVTSSNISPPASP